MDTSKLTFNIIYTPDTVRYLTPFVSTLLRWSDCRYRLISNGCKAAEVELLQQVADLDTRLELLVMPQEGMLPHGDTLDFLHARTDDDYFCFMDSDIVATGPFLKDFSQALPDADVFSSCLPLWHHPDDLLMTPELQHMHGIHSFTERGETIACDYFVVYRNDKLTQTMQDSGVSLKVISWQDIPAPAQKILADMGQQKADYDTGKVLTMLMLNQGDSVTYMESNKLKHIGGFTEVGAVPGALLFSRGRRDNIAARAPGVIGDLLMRQADNYYARVNGPKENSAAENRTLASRNRRRKATARYFYLLLVGLMDDQPVPDVPRLGDRKAEDKIRTVSEEIRTLIREVRSTPGPWQDSA